MCTAANLLYNTKVSVENNWKEKSLYTNDYIVNNGNNNHCYNNNLLMF